MSERIVQVVVGTPEQIRAGVAETAVTTTQAAARLGVCENTIRNMVRSGEIVSCGRFSKTDLFLESDVERLRAQRHQQIRSGSR